MKKFIIIFLTLFITSTSAFAEQQVEDIYDDLLNINQHFFQSATVPDVEIVQAKKTDTKNAETKQGNNSRIRPNNRVDILNGLPVSSNDNKYVNHMPYFKKVRLKLQHAYYDKMKEHDKAVQQKEAFEDTEGQSEDITDNQPSETEIRTELQKQTAPNTTVPDTFITGVKSQATKTELQLDCDEVKVNEETGELEAIGHPVIYFPEDNITLTADKMIYNNEANILKAIDNVVVIKDGTPIYGDFLQVNLNEENIFMDNVKTQTMSIVMNAKHAENENGYTTTYDGNLYSTKSTVYHLRSQFVGPNFGAMLVDKTKQSFLFSGDNTKTHVDASEIYVDAGKYHEVYKIKDAEIFRNNKYLFTLPYFKAYTNKEHSYFETDWPEFGSISNFGMFVGPGWVFKGPYGSIIKAIPLLNYADNKFGFGGAVKFHSAFNSTEIMYGSLNNIFVLNGRQYLDDKLYLDYASNSYMDNWFLGGRMPTYAAELTYDDDYTVKDFLAKGLNLSYSHRISAAIAQDGTYNTNREHIEGSKTVTPRLRYMAQATQTLFSYVNKEERKVFNVSLIMQGSAAVYGTGDTQVIGRIAPSIHTQYKNWMQDISYYISGYSDQTPLPVFDAYRYGHSNLYITEALRLHKYLSIGWLGSISLLKDSPNGEMLQENAFIVAIGPDDCKVSIGYDVVRERTYFSVAVAFDTKNTTINYDKMTIKDIENLGKTESNDKDLSFQQEQPTSNAVKPKIYAQVIDIEDPNKESI